MEQLNLFKVFMAPNVTENIKNVIAPGNQELVLLDCFQNFIKAVPETLQGVINKISDVPFSRGVFNLPIIFASGVIVEI